MIDERIFKLIDAEPLDGRTTRDAANGVVHRLRTEYQDLWDAWATDLVTEAILSLLQQRRHSINAHTRHRARTQAKAQAREEAVAVGDLSLLNKPYVIEGKINRTLGKLTAEDRVFVLGNMDKQLKTRKLERAFLQAVHDKCGDRVVEDVYDTSEKMAELETLFRSVMVND